MIVFFENNEDNCTCFEPIKNIKKCKYHLDYESGRHDFDICSYDKCKYNGPISLCTHKDEEDNCTCFEPEMIEYGSSDAYNDEDEFYKKYCRGCSSLVCSGVRDTVAREGCRYYRHEMKKETPDNLPLPEGAKIALPKYSARISIGNFQINLTDKTFTEEQIKNMKEMLGWEVENL